MSITANKENPVIMSAIHGGRDAFETLVRQCAEHILLSHKPFVYGLAFENGFTADEYPFSVRWQVRKGKHNIHYIVTKKDGARLKSRDIEITVFD